MMHTEGFLLSAHWRQIFGARNTARISDNQGSFFLKTLANIIAVVRP